jgi:hypothetical protein
VEGFSTQIDIFAHGLTSSSCLTPTEFTYSQQMSLWQRCSSPLSMQKPEYKSMYG